MSLLRLSSESLKWGGKSEIHFSPGYPGSEPFSEYLALFDYRLLSMFSFSSVLSTNSNMKHKSWSCIFPKPITQDICICIKFHSSSGGNRRRLQDRNANDLNLYSGLLCLLNKLNSRHLILKSPLASQFSPLPFETLSHRSHPFFQFQHQHMRFLALTSSLSHCLL